MADEAESKDSKPAPADQFPDGKDLITTDQRNKTILRLAVLGDKFDQSLKVRVGVVTGGGYIFATEKEYTLASLGAKLDGKYLCVPKEALLSAKVDNPTMKRVVRDDFGECVDGIYCGSVTGFIANLTGLHAETLAWRVWTKEELAHVCKLQASNIDPVFH